MIVPNALHPNPFSLLSQGHELGSRRRLSAHRDRNLAIVNAIMINESGWQIATSPPSLEVMIVDLDRLVYPNQPMSTMA